MARRSGARRAEQAGLAGAFDGATLNGWKANEHPESWTVKDGTLSCNGERSHLFYVGPDGQAQFTDFEAEFEVFTHTGANSGVYFHTAWVDKGWPTQQGFEMQVNNHQPPFPATAAPPTSRTRRPAASTASATPTRRWPATTSGSP